MRERHDGRLTTRRENCTMRELRKRLYRPIAGWSGGGRLGRRTRTSRPPRHCAMLSTRNPPSARGKRDGGGATHDVAVVAVEPLDEDEAPLRRRVAAEAFVLRDDALEDPLARGERGRGRRPGRSRSSWPRGRSAAVTRGGDEARECVRSSPHAGTRSPTRPQKTPFFGPRTASVVSPLLFSRQRRRDPPSRATPAIVSAKRTRSPHL